MPKEQWNRWGVWCQVSGGVTGYREAWLKSNGEILIFTRDDAETRAAEERRKSQDYKGPAQFQYTAREIY